MRCWILIIIGWICSSPVFLFAQTPVVLSGSVRNSKGEPIPQSTIRLKDSSGRRILAFSLARSDGSFVLRQVLVVDSMYQLEIGHIQYQLQTRFLFLTTDTREQTGLDFILSERVNSLDEVVIRAKPPAFTVRGDTAEFRASAYRTAESRKVEDILRNIPGFDVGGDGRIRFNGKEVDRILVEGDDLTDKNYRLLSRNLHAGLVDKVQVMSRYDENRLMATVTNPEKVGINLTIDPKYLHRWSGTLEAGLGTGGERMADLNLVRLAPRFKLIQFLQHNTIGLTANTDMNHYFRDGDPMESLSALEPASRELLKAGNIQPPPVGTAYTRDNKDQSGFTILSWKVKPHVRMKILAGGQDTRAQFLSRGQQDVLQPDGTGWRVSFEDGSRAENREALLRYSLQHDAGKNNLGNYVAELALGRADHHYANFSSGAITDSLRENLQTSQVLFHIRGQESFRLRGPIVLNALFSARRDRPEQDFDAGTGRFRDYFRLDSSFLSFQQELSMVRDRGEADVTVSCKRKYIRWSTGLRVLVEGYAYMEAALAGKSATMEDSLLRQGEAYFHSRRHTAYGSLHFPQGKKGEWGIGIAAGYGMTESGGKGSRVKTEGFVYRILVGYSRAFSPLQQFSIRYQSSQDLPSSSMFHPPGLLSGQGMILDAAGIPRFPVMHALQASVVSNNLQRGTNWLAMVSGSLGNRQYNTALDAYPAYTVAYPMATDGNRNLSLQLKGERFLKSLRSKFSLQGSGMFLDDRLAYNGQASRNRAGSMRIQGQWTSAFRGIMNAELSLTSWYTRNLTVPDSGLLTRFSQWQHQGYAKMRLTISSRVFAALQYNGYLLSAGNYFQSLDTYARWTIGSDWSVALYGHNLLQSRVIEQRQFSVNAQSVQSFVLVRRYLMVRIQWQF